MPTDTIRSNRAGQRAIIDQLELDLVGDPAILRPLARDLQLVFGQGDAGHLHTRDTIEIQRHPAPAAADVEHPLPRLESELGGDVRLFVELRLFEAVSGIGVISAAILLVVVEECFVEFVRQVVMMGDIAPRRRGRVAAERRSNFFSRSCRMPCAPCRPSSQRLSPSTSSNRSRMVPSSITSRPSI